MSLPNLARNFGLKPANGPAEGQIVRCPRCQSTSVDKHILSAGEPGYGTHHAKATCHDCGSFIRWLPDPRVTADFERRAGLARKMQSRPNLTQFERGFLATMTTQRKLSPRQDEIWREMLAKVR